MKAILFIGLSFWLVGCKTKAPTVVTTSRTDSIYINKLLPYPLPADSAAIRALMECDENGKVILRWLDTANSKNVQLLFTLDSLGEMRADMKVLRDTVYIPSKEVIVTKEVEVPILVKKKVSRWEKVKIEVGGWAIGLLSGGLIIGMGYVIKWLRQRGIK